MTTWAVVPVKRFEAAKSRLSSVLDEAARSAFARTLFDHVCDVLRDTPGIDGVLVVTDSAEVAERGEARGAVPLLDPPFATGLNDCVDFGLREIARRGAKRGVVLMGDLPDLSVDNVRSLLGELDRFEVVVVRDTSGRHTNALALRLEAPFPTSFGREDSFRRHCDTATRRGLSLGVPEVASLAFDVDTPDDFARAR